MLTAEGPLVGLEVLTRSEDGEDGEDVCSPPFVVVWLVVPPGLPPAPAGWGAVVPGFMDLVVGGSVVLLTP